MQKILELSTALIAAAAGLWAFKRLNRFHRLVFWQVVAYLVFDGIAIAVGNDNNWVYTLQIPVEAALLFSAAQSCFGSKASRNVLLVLYGVVISVLCIDMIYYIPIRGLASHALIMQYMLTAGVYIVLLYTVFVNTNSRSFNASYIVMSIGTIIYFLGTVPYLCLMFYFQKLNPIQNDQLFMLIVLSLGLLRYLFVAVAFVLARQTAGRIERKIV